ncbi:serine protease [Bradyrhizobium sp. STM 3562]|uniref:S1 family peptidase n=1 Tax=Bradyrhizobium sp. STM 3562 TaxID=578924 RepID=UPI00388D9C7C
MRGPASELFLLFTLLADTSIAATACVDPTQLAHSAVRLTRYFDELESHDHRGLVGVRGTGWFLSPTTIVTAEHVTAAMTLSTQSWKPLEIVDEDGSQFVPTRIQRVAGPQTERLAIIELQRAVSDARSVAIRKEPLAPDEQVMVLTYPAGRPQLITGRFVQFGDYGKLIGLVLLEMYDGDNRLIVDHGASGAPVFDCKGRIAAVVSNVFTQSIEWAHHEIRISTAWGMPNVVSVPIQALDDSSPQPH